MKRYLDLIPISAKVHRRQTRMTRWCIMISVFLISAIFGMADMFLQSQKNLAIMTDGAWHVRVRDLDEEQTALLAARPEVKTLTRYAATNYALDMDYKVQGVQTLLCGYDETFFALFPGVSILEGDFPKETGQALVTEGMCGRLGVSVGDEVKVETPDGFLDFQISGIVEDTSMLLKADAFGLFMDTETYLSCFREATQKEDFVSYVEFVPHCRMQKAIKDICAQLHIPQDRVSENAKVMGAMMQSSDNYILMLYLIAFVLAVLVAVSGMMMILGSMNSSVAQRTEFFGMMRCLGATAKQVRRYVRAEALYWCLKAVPLGLLLSVVTVWGLCRMLQALAPKWFSEMPGFGISLPGVVFGILIGLLTVLFASRKPARKASEVSPRTAVSGNADTVFAVRRAAYTGRMHVETALGLHHAAGSRKNLILLTSSFAFSIILFLGFGIGIDFMSHALVGLRPDAPGTVNVEEAKAVYFSFALFVYGFLAVVALIAAFNIINSIAMSVAARMRQYGAMRAIGITVRQLQTMVAAETLAYLLGGLAEGLLLGLPLHYFLYQWAITDRWGDVWSLPFSKCLVIAAVMIVAAVAAMTGPIRRIREMSVVETISTS